MSDGKLHSKLGASSYYRWGASIGGCPGSVKASEGIESVSSIYAEEGTKAHEIAASWLNDFHVPNDDPEMWEAVQVYVDYVTSLRDERPFFEAVEQKLDLSKYHPELFGTADYVAYFKNSKTLHVVDYKHGRGIPVEVEENGIGNPQLLYYALGALHQNCFPISKVVATIVQPRCYHPKGPVRSYVADSMELLDFSFQLVQDAKATEDPKAPLNPGDHCRFCPAQPTCPALRKKVIETMFADETATSLVPSNTALLSADKLAFYLSKIPQIKAWCESIHEFAYQEASAGKEIPGWKLVDKRANRRWAEGVTPANLALTFNLSHDKVVDEKPKSPAQVEKFLDKSQKFLLEEFTVKESSGKTLVPVVDDRPSVPGKLVEMFPD